MDKIQSRGTDFIEAFSDCFRFDKDATSSRLGEVKIFKRISEPWQYVTVKSIAFSELDPLTLKNLQLFYSQNGQFIGTQHNVHPNLTQLYGLNVSYEKQKVDLYLEYCSTTIKEQINLRLQHSLHFSPQELWRTTLSIILGAEYLQAHGAFIGDVRTSRIFINKKGLVKVIPYMQSCYDIDCYQRCTLFGDHSCFLSPEFLQQLQNHQAIKLDSQSMHKNDVFGLGLSILEMATLRDSAELIDWERYSLKSSVMQVRIDFAKSLYGDFFGEILQNMLDISQSERSSSSQLLSKLFPYQEAIITGAGFDQIPQLHSKTNFEIKKLNELKSNLRNKDNHVNSNLIAENGILGVDNNEFSNHNNNFIKIDVFSPNKESIMAKERQKESNLNNKPIKEEAAQTTENKHNLTFNLPGAEQEARHSQNSQFPSFLAAQSLNNPLNQTSNLLQNATNSPIRVENHMLNANFCSPKSNNINHQAAHLENQNSSIIQSIPTEAIDENNNNNKDLNYVKHFCNINNNNNNSNLSSRSSQTVSTKAFGEKPKNEEHYQIIQNQIYNDPIIQRNMEIQNVRFFQNQSVTQIENTNHLNNSLSPPSQINLEMNSSNSQKQYNTNFTCITSKEPVVSFTDLSANTFFCNPQFQQSQKNYPRDNIRPNIATSNTNKLSFNNSTNLTNKSNQTIFTDKLQPRTQTLNSTCLPSKGLSATLCSSNNLNYQNQNKSLSYQNLELTSPQIPSQVSFKSTVLPSQLIPNSTTAQFVSDYRKPIVPVKKIILNSMLQPLTVHNSQVNDVSLSSSTRNLQRYQPLVQINLQGDTQQQRMYPSIIKTGSCSRSVSPQSYLIQRQITPPATSIIIRKNSLPAAQQINLCSTPIKQQPLTNLLFQPESNSRQLSPVIRFQQVDTPSSTQKILSATADGFYTPQQATFTQSQFFSRNLNVEQEQHQQQSRQTTFLGRGRQRHQVELFKKEYQLK